MVAGTTVRREYQFGPFQLDARERRLVRDGSVIPLRLKVFDTLLVLVENAGRLMTKQELLDAIWPRTTVEEHNLNHNVSVLRKALAERATGQQYIDTVPRVGYRFVAAVEGPIPDAASAESSSAVFDFCQDRPEVTSIAVLPFADMSERRDQDYLCEGIAEEIINALTHINGRRVAARSASLQFRGPGVDLGTAGEQLGAPALPRFQVLLGRLK